MFVNVNFPEIMTLKITYQIISENHVYSAPKCVARLVVGYMGGLCPKGIAVCEMV